MPRRRTLSSALCALALAAACKPGSGASTDPCEHGFFQDYAAVFCPAAAACCESQGAQPDTAACADKWHAFGTFACNLGVAIDAEAAATCIEELKVAAAECPPREPDVCKRVVVGPIPPGGKCVHDYLCAHPPEGYTHCVERPVGPDTLEQDYFCVGVVSAKEGEPCGSEYPPVLSRSCEPEDTLYCSAKICTPRLALGEPCELNEACPAGSSCLWTCVVDAPVGQSCEAAACGEGAFCDAAKICQPQALPGASCTDDLECTTSFCSSTGICQSSWFVSSECSK
jgi:hypothetical protein